MTDGQRKRIAAYLEILKTEPLLYMTAQKLMMADSHVTFEQAVYDTVFAPVLFCFVNWVLEEARKKGIKRLYFLARDGYQMYLVADALCKEAGDEIECRYLYGSRYAWRIPQFALEGELCLDKICLGGIDVTFEKVMKRGNLTDEEALAVAEELGFVERYQIPLSYYEVQQLKQPLRVSSQFLSYVYTHSKEAYAETLGYLKQEGLFDETSYAIVDSGWTGSMQRTLRQLLQNAGFKKRIRGFYFGLYELPPSEEIDSYYTYYFGPKGGIRKKVYFSNCLYETVYSAPHGMTVGYEDKDGSYMPVFGGAGNLNQRQMEQILIWLEIFLAAYQEKRKEHLRQPMKISETKQMVCRLLSRLMGTPIKDEVESYGTLLFSDDVTEDDAQEVAATLSLEELKNHRFLNKACIMLGVKKGMIRDSAWPEGSVVKNGSRIKSGLRHTALYKYVLYIRKAIRK